MLRCCVKDCPGRNELFPFLGESVRQKLPGKMILFISIFLFLLYFSRVTEDTG